MLTWLTLTLMVKLKTPLYFIVITCHFVIYLLIWLIFGQTNNYNQTYKMSDFDMTMTLYDLDRFTIVITFSFIEGFNLFLGRTRIVQIIIPGIILATPRGHMIL